jgi:hypothetical protein
MKLAVVVLFLVAIWRIFHHSRGFSRFLQCYKDRPTLVDAEKVFQSVLDHFKKLVIKIAIWLAIASACFFDLLLNLIT